MRAGIQPRRTSHRKKSLRYCSDNSFFPRALLEPALGLVKKPMDPVTKWFLSGLRDLSLFLEQPSLSGTRFYGRALSVRVETQGVDALIEKTDRCTSCPHDYCNGFASLPHLLCHNESPRERESLHW